jgi:hypothetical protein
LVVIDEYVTTETGYTVCFSTILTSKRALNASTTVLQIVTISTTKAVSDVIAVTISIAVL